jgi:hypothetical protein
MFWGSVSACSLTTASFVQPEEWTCSCLCHSVQNAEDC